VERGAGAEGAGADDDDVCGGDHAVTSPLDRVRSMTSWRSRPPLAGRHRDAGPILLLRA
jgi:hypothetical protein